MNTIGILPGAATMAIPSMIAACRACYDAANYLFRSSTVGRAVRLAWRRGDAWEVAYWCAWLQCELARPDGTAWEPSNRRDLARNLDRALTDLCCADRISPADAWGAIPVRVGDETRRAA